MGNNERASLEDWKFKYAIKTSSEMVDWRIEGIWLLLLFFFGFFWWVKLLSPDEPQVRAQLH